MSELTVPVDIVRLMLDLPRLRSQNNQDMERLLNLLPDQSDQCRIAELGCFTGECSVQFLSSPRVAQVVCVDWWKGDYDPNDLASGANMLAAQTAFNIRTLSWRDTKLQVQPCSTQAAVAHYQDHSFDLVYLDADHRYESVVADINAWRSKVKPGGYLAGHDYSTSWHLGVKAAVDELLGHPHHIFSDTSWAVKL